MQDQTCHWIGYILKMFPRLSETFILNEILELENQGMDLRIFSLRRPVDLISHRDVELVRARIVYLPQTIWGELGRVLLAHLWTWRRHAAGYGWALHHLARKRRQGSSCGPWLELSQACVILREGQGATGFHAHYVNLPAKMALLVHRISGIPYSVTTHAKDIFLNQPLACPHVQERMTSARFLVANSHLSARHIARNVAGLTQPHVIYNGINLAAFPPRASEPKERVILAVGRFVEKKGFAVLIDACRHLHERGVAFRCELVGSGRMSDDLKSRIAQAGLQESVRLLGPLAQESLRHRFEQAMIFALPCIEAADGDRDILPNVLKEAMAIGVPVVTSQLSGIEELVEHAVTGLLVPPSDSRALADCLELLLGDPALRQALARQAWQVVRDRFDRRRCFGQLKQLLAHGEVTSPARPRVSLQKVPH